jgi:hypothetical protein
VTSKYGRWCLQSKRDAALFAQWNAQKAKADADNALNDVKNEGEKVKQENKWDATGEDSK